MKKYVIISSNWNPDYEFYIPVVTWAWAKFGWEVVVMRPFKNDTYRDETITQCIRLYAASLFKDDDMIMTSDADMIPLSDYWKPDPEIITTYGHDLTNYQHVPICYIAMTAKKWKEVMCLTENYEADLLKDLKLINVLSMNKDLWWVVDQDIITATLKLHQFTNVIRGIEPGSYLPYGRMDRTGMVYPKELIDFHAPRNPKEHINKIREVILKAFGECPEL